MNYNYFIENKCMFGSYPSTEKDVINLINLGVVLFVNLVTPEEKLTDYTNILQNKNIEYINFPISDNKHPNNIYDFYKLIYNISNKIKNINSVNNEKIYIHCKGGHGRSGMVSCFVLCFMYNISPELSIKYITECHRNRENLKKKWINSKCPNSKRQRFFIFKSFVKILIYNQCDRENIFYGLNLNSNHEIKINNILFQNGEIALKTIIEENHKEIDSETIENILKDILIKKFEQNKKLIYTLIRTGIKSIIYDIVLREIAYKYSIRVIKIGRILEEIRRMYYNKALKMDI
jgi:protein-tyrosine phosphatase